MFFCINLKLHLLNYYTTKPSDSHLTESCGFNFKQFRNRKIFQLTTYAMIFGFELMFFHDSIELRKIVSEEGCERFSRVEVVQFGGEMIGNAFEEPVLVSRFFSRQAFAHTLDLNVFEKFLTYKNFMIFFYEKCQRKYNKKLF